MLIWPFAGHITGELFIKNHGPWIGRGKPRDYAPRRQGAQVENLAKDAWRDQPRVHRIAAAGITP